MEQAGQTVEDIGRQGGNTVVGEVESLEAIILRVEEVGGKRRNVVVVDVEPLQGSQAVEDVLVKGFQAVVAEIKE